MVISSTGLSAISFAIVMIMSLILGLFIKNKLINSTCAIIFVISTIGTTIFSIKYLWEIFG